MNELLTIGIPTLAVLVGILVNNRRLSDLRSHTDARFNDVGKRFDDLKSVMDARFEKAHAELIRVGQVMDARLRHLEEGRG
jgi:hypothetical protein